MKQVTQMFTQIYSQLDTNPSLPKQTGLFSLQDREPFAVKLRVVMLWLTVLICSFLYSHCEVIPTNGDDHFIVARSSAQTEISVSNCADLNDVRNDLSGKYKLVADIDC